jgi:hypothetical protein
MSSQAIFLGSLPARIADRFATGWRSIILERRRDLSDQGSPFMQLVTPAQLARILAALFVFLVPIAGSAQAGDHHYWVSHDPAIGYAVPYQRVIQFPAVLVNQPPALGVYAMPFDATWQFRGAFFLHPGRDLRYGGSLYSVYDEFAGPSFIPH